MALINQFKTTMSGAEKGFGSIFGGLVTHTPLSLLKIDQSASNWQEQSSEGSLSGSGTSYTHSSDAGSGVLACSATTAGKHIFQSRGFAIYQPDRDQRITLTVGDFVTTTGITKEVGYKSPGGDKIFMRSQDGTIYFGKTSNATGTPVETLYVQSSWDDPMDGTGEGPALDFSKRQVFLADFGWLGTAALIFEFLVGDQVYEAKKVQNSNEGDDYPWIGNPRGQIYWSIENDGTGAASTFRVICGEVDSIGGLLQGTPRSYPIGGGAALTTGSSGTWYPLISLRPIVGSATRVRFASYSVIVTSNSSFETAIVINPTLVGTDNASWVSDTHAGLEYDISRGATASISTAVGDGLWMFGSLGTASNDQTSILSPSQSIVGLGERFDGTVDSASLCVKTVVGSGSEDYRGFLSVITE